MSPWAMNNALVEQVCRKCCLGHRDIVASDFQNRKKHIYIPIRSVS